VRTFRLTTSPISGSHPADLVVGGASVASAARDTPGAIARGGIPGIIDGQVRMARSPHHAVGTCDSHASKMPTWLE
jgi:hypothetical protein